MSQSQVLMADPQVASRRARQLDEEFRAILRDAAPDVDLVVELAAAVRAHRGEGRPLAR